MGQRRMAVPLPSPCLRGYHGGMDAPLSNSQQALHGRKVTDMTEAQLRDWIVACERMEAWPHTQKKARRDWKNGRTETVTELIRRGLSVDSG